MSDSGQNSSVFYRFRYILLVGIKSESDHIPAIKRTNWIKFVSDKNMNTSYIIFIALVF